MIDKKKCKAIVSILIIMTAITISLQVINSLTQGWLTQHFGLLPRSLSGIWGIFLSPWIHNSWEHVFSNLPLLLLLSTLIMLESIDRFIKLSLFIIIVGGLLVWLFGRYAYHVGASGWIFGLWAWLIVRSYFQRSLKNFIISIFIIFIYGGVAWGFVPQTGVSVEGHIAGAICGVLAASILRKQKK